MADGDLTDDDMSTAAKREPEITVGGARPRRWLGYPWRLLRAVSFFCAGRWPPPADGGRQPVESILVLQANHIGDLLMTTPLLEVLRKGFPRARITVAAGAWNAETLAHNPHVDEFFTLPAPWDNAFVKPQSALARLRFLLFSREARELARRRFGVGIDAVGTRTNATMLIRIRPGRLLGPFFTDKPVPTGPERRHRIEVQLDHAATLGLPATAPILPQIFLTAGERARGAELWVDGDVPAARRPYRVVIAPASSRPYTCWSMDDFREVTRILHGRGDVALAIIGGNDTLESAAHIATVDPTVRNYAGRIRLRETFGLIANADFVLCNANLAWHVAAAFDVPSAVVLTAAYLSAARERSEWGYPTSRVLGRDATHDGAYSAGEVAAIIGVALDSRPRGASGTPPG
jgi:ADP-heptose:LPS heptosyltransferase